MARFRIENGYAVRVAHKHNAIRLITTVQRDHLISSHVCWCKPEVLAPCPECNRVKTDCWLCRGRGLIAPDSDYEGDLVVVHKEEQDGAV